MFVYELSGCGFESRWSHLKGKSFAVIFQGFHMLFRKTCFKEQLSVIASVGHENVLALTIRIEMCVFLCFNKSEISFVFLLKALLSFE